mmetsp:Transcript_77291/g.205135  ORF Transcript_77291/g.205135 Transcript_77291/m.205135 type:complete len:1201 (-) Transcript_77291:165-3767(-)
MFSNAVVSLRRPLEGSLVEIHGLKEKLEPSPETKAQHPSAPAVDVNGERGRAIGWSEKDGKYIVETFDGVVLGVEEDNLKELFPSTPQDGGFDLAWPSGPHSHSEFAADLVEHLDSKGFCLIQMFSNSRMRDAAKDEALEMHDWKLPTKELEAAYLGHENQTKYVVLPQDNFLKKPESGLEQCDRILSNLGLLLRPLTQDFFGFTIDGRTNCNVCVPLANAAEEKLLRPAELFTGDGESEQKVHGHVNFLSLRRIKLMYVIDTDGGEIILQPSSGGESGSGVSIPLSRNQLLVMLPDRLSYTYRPQGNSLLLQTWFMSQPPIQADALESRRVVRLPELQRDERVHFTSMVTRIPGCVTSKEQAWNMWISGTDGSIKVPQNRFDIDFYYNPEPYSGMLYVKHAAVVMDYLMDSIDYKHFNLTELEAQHMGPGQRNLMEIGMESLYQSGFTKESLWGAPVGVYIGDKNTDRKSAVPGKIALEAMNGIEMPTCGHSGFNSGVTAARLSYALNMKGPVTDIDTACSSALVAMGEAMRGMRKPKRGDLKPTAWTGLDTSLVMGMDLVDSPWTFFAYCSAQMVSIGGRSFTFDESANGFLRGDGVGACVLEMDKADHMAQDMLACLMGTNVNQDGKSASLSAPHGPSQQQCIRASMQEAGLVASEITIAECHGTGTALGDPIEVGALKETMKKRPVPLVMTSAKSNFGHTEAAAGIAGIGRCLVMLLSMTGACNLHLKSINPHIEFIGYPALFITEAVDCGVQTGISGVSSFGVGGTNARGDIWARAVYGYQSSDVVLPMRKLAFDNSLHSRIRDNGKPGPGTADELFLFGSWDGWSDMAEMQNTAEGEWTATVTLGEVQRERFRVCLNRIPHLAFYPAVDQADSEVEVLGPDWEHDSNAWVIDARADKAVGSVYRITFRWSFDYETGERRRISWERVDGPEGDEPHVDGRTGQHSYWTAATWTGWNPVRMTASSEKEGLYEASVRLGTKGMEEFQILRDQDWKQVIHPAAAKATKTSVPVRGPDSRAGDKAWVIKGSPGDAYTIQIEVSDKAIVVRALSAATFVKQQWTTVDDDDKEAWHDYWVVGTFASQFVPMSPEQGGSNVFRCTVQLGDYGYEEFQISVDRDPDQMLYPAIGGAFSGESAVLGPDNAGSGLAWNIVGTPGAKYEIVLDWTKESSDVLWWSEVVEARRAIEEAAEVADKEES